MKVFLYFVKGQSSQPAIEGATKMTEDERGHSIFSRCFAEMIAVLIFVYVGSTQAFSHSSDPVLHAAFAHGAAIFVLVATFGGLSGGHVNPAVTLGITLVGKLSPVHAVCYVCSQLVGSVLGALLVRISLDNVAYEGITAGATVLSSGVSWYHGLTAEVMTTYILVQTVLMTAVDTDKNVLAPLAIGFSIIIDILAAGSLSGASMNPARSFGPNVIGQLFLSPHHLDQVPAFWSYHWIYYIGPALGAFLAAGVYRVFFARDFRVLA
ncbi:unnamed protein product [Caenorhabditis auriculariae]|uniref:Uncharacterized protein n=1 Tax=Caenorhabditis auriculariae TaxID=2777116 RepID=A0A8S1HTZ8_9PELO|nr:unnamed protein product [Caenorhabditis auriculariae]